MNSSSNDDIDLEIVLIRLIRFIRSKFKGIVIAAITGALALGALTFLQPRQYTSKMILRSDILTEPYTERIAEKLRSIIKEGNAAELARLLNLSQQDAEQVGTIEIESVAKKEEVKDKDPSTFVVTVEVTDNAVLPRLEQGIIHLLQENDFVKIRVAHRRKFLTTMIAKLDREISALDTLKRQLMSGTLNNGSKSGAVLVDPSQVYTTLVELTQRSISFKNELELVNSIELVDGFVALNKAVKPHRGLAMMAGFSGGLLIYLVILTLQQLVKKSELDTE
jgi:hypothetical protein